MYLFSLVTLSWYHINRACIVVGAACTLPALSALAPAVPDILLLGQDGLHSLQIDVSTMAPASIVGARPSLTDGARVRAVESGLLKKLSVPGGEDLVRRSATLTTVACRSAEDGSQSGYCAMAFGGARLTANQWEYSVGVTVIDRAPLSAVKAPTGNASPRVSDGASETCSLRVHPSLLRIGQVLHQPLLAVAEPSLVHHMRGLFGEHLDLSLPRAASDLQGDSEQLSELDASGFVTIRLEESQISHDVDASGMTDVAGLRSTRLFLSKFILCQRADAFSVMLATQMAESQSNQIFLTDAKLVALLGLFHFMYTGEIDLSLLSLGQLHGCRSHDAGSSQSFVSEFTSPTSEEHARAVGKRARSASGGAEMEGPVVNSFFRRSLIGPLRAVWQRWARDDTAAPSTVPRASRDSAAGRSSSSAVLGSDPSHTRDQLRLRHARGSRLDVSVSIQDLASVHVRQSDDVSTNLYLASCNNGLHSSLGSRAHLFSLGTAGHLDVSQQVMLISSCTRCSLLYSDH